MRPTIEDAKRVMITVELPERATKSRQAALYISAVRSDSGVVIYEVITEGAAPLNLLAGDSLQVTLTGIYPSDGE